MHPYGEPGSSLVCRKNPNCILHHTFNKVFWRKLAFFVVILMVAAVVMS